MTDEHKTYLNSALKRADHISYRVDVWERGTSKPTHCELMMLHDTLFELRTIIREELLEEFPRKHNGTESAKMILSEPTYRAIARSSREFQNKGWDFTIDELAKLVAERKITDIRGIGKDRARECEQAVAKYYPNGNPYCLVLSKKE